MEEKREKQLAQKMFFPTFLCLVMQNFLGEWGIMWGYQWDHKVMHVVVLLCIVLLQVPKYFGLVQIFWG